MKIEINLKGPPTGYRCANTLDVLPFSKISCIAEGACHGLDITLNNAGCENVMVDRLDCTDVDACTDAKFEFIGNVEIKFCVLFAMC